MDILKTFKKPVAKAFYRDFGGIKGATHFELSPVIHPDDYFTIAGLSYRPKEIEDVYLSMGVLGEPARIIAGFSREHIVDAFALLSKLSLINSRIWYHGFEGTFAYETTVKLLDELIASNHIVIDEDGEDSCDIVGLCGWLGLSSADAEGFFDRHLAEVIVRVDAQKKADQLAQCSMRH